MSKPLLGIPNKLANSTQQAQLDAMERHRMGWLNWGAEMADGTMHTFYATSVREATEYAKRRLPDAVAIVVNGRYGTPVVY